MAFEVEAELTENFISGFLKNTQGHTEEITIKTTQDLLESLLIFIEGGRRDSVALPKISSRGPNRSNFVFLKF